MAKPGALRIISDDQVDQVRRLGKAHFEYPEHFADWLDENYDCAVLRGDYEPTDDELYDQIRKLATAQRAGQVIGALKAMHDLAAKEK